MVNKCDAPTGRCEEDSMCVNGDGPPVQRLIHHQRRGGIMTPPMTDAELLAYIERTPELAALFPDAARWLSPHAAPYANVARAFHAHEQRVREEERKIISAGVAFIMGPGGDEGTRMGLHPDSPYRETVDEQGEAAEVVGLLAEADALEVELRSEPFNASGFLTRAAIKDLRRRARAILTKQGGK